MKRWLSCIMAMVMVLSLVACGGGSDAPAKDEGSSEATGSEIVIKYPTFQVGANTAAPVVAELVKQFNEKYAGQYRIEVEDVPGDANYADKIKVQLSTGELPVVVYGGGYKLLDLALEADLVVDLTVQPGEIVNAFFLLGLFPARLESDPFHAEGSHLVVYLFGVKRIPIQLFHTKPPGGVFDFTCVLWCDLADLFQSFHG